MISPCKPNYFSADPDLAVTREGVKIIKKIFSQRTIFKPYLGKPISPDKFGSKLTLR